MRTGAHVGATLLAALLAACGDGPTGPETPLPVAASVAILPGAACLPPGESVQLQAKVVDVGGRELTSHPVEWASASGTVVQVSSTGLATAVGLGGPVSVSGATLGKTGEASITVLDPVEPPPAATAMLGGLEGLIQWAIARNAEALPLNPALGALLQARIDLLQRPWLADEIHDCQYFEGGDAASPSKTVPVAALFPERAMRGEAAGAIRYVEGTLPRLEGFLGLPFTPAAIQIWYGFALGGAGSGGALYMEDRGTYDRRQPSGLPYDAILAHELAHSWYGHEALTQFLELYAFNVAATGSGQVAQWIHRRDYAAGRGENTGVHALLDIYGWIGAGAMAEAYRAIHPLRIPYGQPLPPAAIQAFVDVAPLELRELVRARAAAIGV